LFSEDKKVICLFYLLLLGSFAVVGFFSIFICGISYIEFYTSIAGRLINITVFFTIFLFIIDRRNRNYLSTNDMLHAYLIGCYILLFFGIWQLTNNLFGMPYPDWITRNSVHSIDVTDLLSFITKRITSIAREPAYLVPYLVDAVILLSYTSRKYFSILFYLIIIFFTLSLSAYINIFLIGVIMFVFMRRSKKKSLLVLLLYWLASG
jgi:hypothetical protein